LQQFLEESKEFVENRVMVFVIKEQGYGCFQKAIISETCEKWEKFKTTVRNRL
jgi:hypothetical protein